VEKNFRGATVVLGKKIFDFDEKNQRATVRLE